MATFPTAPKFHVYSQGKRVKNAKYDDDQGPCEEENHVIDEHANELPDIELNFILGNV